MRKINHALVAGIVLAVLAGALVVIVIGQANRTVAVYVANQNLSARKQILASYVSVAHLKPSDVPPGTVTSYSQIVGHYTLAPIFADQTFQAGALASSVNEAAVVTSGLAPDERAFAVQANVAQALAGRIQAGDLVDVVAVVNSSGTPTGGSSGSAATPAAPSGEFAQTIITQVSVLDINLPASAIQAQATSGTTTGGVNPANTAQQVTVPGIYTLALTPAEVQEVALAENVGTLYLSLDPFGKVSPYKGTPTGLGSLATTSQGPKVTAKVTPSASGRSGATTPTTAKGRG